MENPLASYYHQAGGFDETLVFLKRTRSELREVARVRIWKDKVRIYDVNKDAFEITGLGYQDEEIKLVIEFVNAVCDQTRVMEPTDAEYKEFKTGKRFPWAHDRVL